MAGQPGTSDYDRINDAQAAPEERTAALRAFVAAGGTRDAPAFSGEINNHIHTIYSFSPYTPSMAALKAREAGLEAAGSVDHDSYAAAPEMRAACAALGLGCVTGFELRASLRHTEFGSRKINSPDSPGIVYMTIQGVPAPAAPRVAAFLEKIHAARRARNLRMVDALNGLLAGTGIGALDYGQNIEPLSQAARGGSVTERHVLFALALALIQRAGKGPPLLAFLRERFGVEVTGKNAAYLADENNPYYAYDLLGALKGSFNDRIFIQPDAEECPAVESVTAFAREINAVPSYAYLGDVTDSVTGDKKAEKFEDDYLDALVPRLVDFGFQGVTYMPPRNTAAQLARLRGLCAAAGLIEISGVDINSPRQRFECPEIRRPEFAPLVATTWALAAHERLASEDPRRGLFNPADPLAGRPLEERVAAFADAGRRATRA